MFGLLLSFSFLHNKRWYPLSLFFFFFFFFFFFPSLFLTFSQLLFPPPVTTALETKIKRRPLSFVGTRDLFSLLARGSVPCCSEPKQKEKKIFEIASDWHHPRPPLLNQTIVFLLPPDEFLVNETIRKMRVDGSISTSRPAESGRLVHVSGINNYPHHIDKITFIKL